MSAKPEADTITLRRDALRAVSRSIATDLGHHGNNFAIDRIAAAIIAAAVPHECDDQDDMRRARDILDVATNEDVLAYLRTVPMLCADCGVLRGQRHAQECVDAGNYGQPKMFVPSAPLPASAGTEGRDAIVHASIAPWVSRCGADYPNMRTTSVEGNVTCRQCSPKLAASATFRYCTATVTRQSEPIPSQHNGETAYNIGPCGNTLPCSVHPYLLLNPPYSDSCDIDAYRHGFRDGWKERERPKPAASNEPANLGLDSTEADHEAASPLGAVIREELNRG